ncbi:hypothetical protein [Dyella flagellata]|uniref:hypothetical protein n=1 Tax=Dyella flagellata TaxID=1867833 RepID=UPI0024E08C83|nr:hypothetical protein [Dyella flagellata]
MFQTLGDSRSPKTVGLNTAAAVMFLALPHSAMTNVRWGSSYGLDDWRTANAVFAPALPNANATASLAPQVVQPSIGSEPSWGLHIATLRSSLHATTEQLAAAFGVSRQALHSWQSGKKVPLKENKQKIGQLVAAAKSLNDRLGYLVPIYLDYPVGPSDETFWQMINEGANPQSVVDLVVKVALESEQRKMSLGSLDDLLPEDPLDNHM